MWGCIRWNWFWFSPRATIPSCAQAPCARGHGGHSVGSAHRRRTARLLSATDKAPNEDNLGPVQWPIRRRVWRGGCTWVWARPCGSTPLWWCGEFVFDSQGARTPDVHRCARHWPHPLRDCSAFLSRTWVGCTASTLNANTGKSCCASGVRTMAHRLRTVPVYRRRRAVVLLCPPRALWCRVRCMLRSAS